MEHLNSFYCLLFIVHCLLLFVDKRCLRRFKGTEDQFAETLVTFEVVTDFTSFDVDLVVAVWTVNDMLHNLAVEELSWIILNSSFHKSQIKVVLRLHYAIQKKILP